MKYLCVILILIFVSCYNEKKALSDVNKAAVSFPDILAKKARDMFPCVTGKSDTLYISDSAAYKSALNELQDTSFAIYQRNDSLLRHIDSLNKDTTCFKIVDLYEGIIHDLNNQVATWRGKFKHIPPIYITKIIHDTTLDVAALKTCEYDKSSEIKLLDKKTIESDGWQKKAKTRWWVMVIMGAIIGVGTYIKIAGIFKPKLKAV